MEIYTVEVYPQYLLLKTRDGRAAYKVDGYRVFGRGDFMWHPHSIYISRRHFAVGRLGGGYFIEDLGSTNGTFVNGVDIRGMGRVDVKPGDVISVANVVELLVD